VRAAIRDVEEVICVWSEAEPTRRWNCCASRAAAIFWLRGLNALLVSSGDRGCVMATSH